MDDNRRLLLKSGRKLNFLLDTSTILYFQEMHKYCGVSIFKALSECPEVNFFVLNYVLSELMQGKKGMNPTQFKVFLGHILNSEYVSDPNHKEDRFLVEDKGKIKFVVLNKISTTDYAQVVMCQNHKELILVANDAKMIKSAAQTIKERRVVGIPAMLDRILILYPKNERVKALKEAGNQMFIKKHPFGNITEEQFNRKYKK